MPAVFVTHDSHRSCLYLSMVVTLRCCASIVTLRAKISKLSISAVTVIVEHAPNLVAGRPLPYKTALIDWLID